MKIFYGPKGTGKTKLIIDDANSVNEQAKHCVVFITNTKRYMYDLKHTIRFLDVTDFNIKTPLGLIGFIKGIISANADYEYIYVDGIARITGKELSELEEFFADIEFLTEKYNVKFAFTCSCEKDELPEFIKKHI